MNKIFLLKRHNTSLLCLVVPATDAEEMKQQFQDMEEVYLDYSWLFLSAGDTIYYVVKKSVVLLAALPSTAGSLGPGTLLHCWANPP